MSCQSYKNHTLAKKVGTAKVTFKVGRDDKVKEFIVHKKLMLKIPYWASRSDLSGAEPEAVITLQNDNPDAWKLFVEWLYNGTVPESPTKISVTVIPTAIVIQALEEDLLVRFNNNQQSLVFLYGLAEKYVVHDLMNQAIDAIQDGYHEFGTVFGPGLNRHIFLNTKKDSKLRDLCVGTNIIHTDRGCSKLRMEIIRSSMMMPAYFSHLMRWISRNNVMFARRASEGLYDPSKGREGFSMLNRKKLCPCHFHVHENGTAHKDHAKCEIPFLDCGHPEDEIEEEMMEDEDGMEVEYDGPSPEQILMSLLANARGR